MSTTADYLTQLQTDRNNLADNLTALGASSTHSETFTQLAPKVLSIKNILQNLNVVKNANGQSLNLAKVSNAVKGRLNVDGFTRQKTTTGKNLVKSIGISSVAGLSITVNNEGKIVVNGTNSSFASPNCIERKTFSPGTYTFNIENHNSEIYYAKSSDPTTSIYKYAPGGVATITVDEEFILTGIYVYLQAQTYTNHIFYIQVEEGSTATSYEPYTGGQPSPNPDYPSEIRNLEGKNLFNKNNIVTGKTYSSTGELVDLPSAFIQETYIPVSSNAKYTISTTNNYLSTSDYRLVICEYTENKIFIQRTLEFQSTYKTIKTTANTKYVRLCASTVTLNELQFEEGTVATDYVPYNTLRFKKSGKNLLPFTSQDFTLKGIHFYCKDGNLYLDGTSIGEIVSTDFKNSFNFELEAGTYYFARGNITNAGISIKKYNDETILVTNNGSFTLAEKTKIYLAFYIYQQTFNNVKLTLQLEKGSTSTAYEPHKEQIIDFPLQEGQKLYSGSKLTPQGIYNERGQIVLDGSTGIITTPNTNQFNIDNVITDYKKVDNAVTYLCNEYICLKQTNNNAEFISLAENYSYAMNFTNASAYNLRIKDTRFTTIADFTNWLSTHPTTVEYELETPTITPYTETQAKAYNELSNLEMYNGTNIIELDSNEATTIYAEYGENAIEAIKDGITE